MTTYDAVVSLERHGAENYNIAQQTRASIEHSATYRRMDQDTSVSETLCAIILHAWDKGTMLRFMDNCIYKFCVRMLTQVFCGSLSSKEKTICIL